MPKRKEAPNQKILGRDHKIDKDTQERRRIMILTVNPSADRAKGAEDKTTENPQNAQRTL